MKNLVSSAFIYLCITFLFISPGKTCTTFCINADGELIFGKNYDWSIDFGIVFVNKSGVIKTAFTDLNNPAEWVSKFGSVTFNQFGREFPMGGMNEAGLVVELMWLDETVFPAPDDRATTGGILQWIQYQLDNCETIQEVIDTDKYLRIPEGAIPVHYLVTDKHGNSATIEFLKGQLVQQSGNSLQYPVLTNNTYEQCVDNLKYYKDFGGMQSIFDDESSLARFARSCQMISNYSKSVNGNAVDYGFEILNKVNQGDATKWRIVYDINNKMVYYKTLRHRDIKIIDFASLDFNCATPVMMIDINTVQGGNVNSLLSEYSPQANRDLIEKSYNNVNFLREISPSDRDEASVYPEKLNCRNKSELKIDTNENNKDNRDLPYFILTGFIFSTSILVVNKINKKRI